LLDREGRLSAVPKATARSGQSISIVISVYNAHDDLVRCLESVQRHSRPDHPVIVIDDASSDERIWPLLQHWATQHQNFRVVRNDSNLGYTATVNRGCELADPGDIILLNSDTIVPAHWIEQMAACAYSRPAVATVTAISNAAGAFSVPRKNAINELPPGWSVDQMAAFIERNSQRIRPIVPTGNGFCMYITSAARDAVGLFDAEHFPNGYAEENDFCLRASAAGLVNLIDDATYVFHRRMTSFGPTKGGILERSRATLDQLHPEYARLIRDWSQADALDPVRGDMQRRIDAALVGGIESALPRDDRQCLLFLVHDEAEGTRFRAEDLSRALTRRYRVILLRTAVESWSLDRFFDHGLAPVRRYSFPEPRRVDAPMIADRLAVLAEICGDYKVDVAHVHDFLASGPELLIFLRQLNIPIVSPELRRAVEAPPCSILFLMNLRAAGGGVNSIVQEAGGLRKLGAVVQVAIRRQDESFYRERFPGVARNLFRVFESIAELIGYARHFEFVVATAFKTVRTLKTLLEQAPGVVPCYYIQDYEPNFCHSNDANYREAVESYTLVPEMRCFAKTRWLCETVAQRHGLDVRKVEPSLDREIFFPDNRPKPGTPFIVCAMVRPVSEYRSPGLTFEILRRIKHEFGENVEIRMFGLEQNDPFLARQPVDFEYKLLGILDRQGVAKLMRESSLFIDASTYQAFGRTGLEAMACRCATILPAEGGISEYAVDGVNTLLAAPNDAEDVFEKVRRYIREPQLYQSILEEGLKTASRYSIEKACASELQFFESLRRSTGAEPSAAPCVARSKSPASSVMHRYAVVDLGTKTGGAIDAFRRLAVSHQMTIPPGAIFFGIDRSDQYRNEVTQKGYEFLAADITSPEFVWPAADYYLAWNFLEHLPDRQWSKKVVIQMCRHATAGIWLRLPSFEQDSVTGEAALKKNGLRFAWSHWHGHPSHFLVEDALEALNDGLKNAQWSHRLEQKQLIHDSNHPDVVPIGAPIDTVKYDPNLGVRPEVRFVPPVVGQWDIIVSIQRKAAGPAVSESDTQKASGDDLPPHTAPVSGEEVQ
jgi:GT2 family glycosyltransferase/glycosyltransferase involved in cell wall biosynthesis